MTRLCALYVAAADMASLRALLTFLRPFFALIPKARTAKIVRGVIEALGRVPGSTEVLVAVCMETVEWCKAEKRSFLRLRVQLKLAALQLEQEKMSAALATVNGLLREVKRLDDKALLVELHLIESRVYHALRNGCAGGAAWCRARARAARAPALTPIPARAPAPPTSRPKARAALTAGRTAAGSIYVGPDVQAAIDLHAGFLCADERDFRTAFSCAWGARSAQRRE